LPKLCWRWPCGTALRAIVDLGMQASCQRTWGSHVHVVRSHGGVEQLSGLTGYFLLNPFAESRNLAGLRLTSQLQVCASLSPTPPG
jgi:hypothetical protein